MTMNKTELLDLIDSARARIDAVIARVPESRMDDIALYDAWTMKDFIAHLTFWESQVMSVYDILQAGGLPWADEENVPVDAVNAKVLTDSKTRSLEHIREEAARVHATMRDGVAGISDEILFTSGYYSWLGDDRAFQFWVEVNSYEHYDEHRPDVEAWLESQGL
jgi:hypothetical protein